MGHLQHINQQDPHFISVRKQFSDPDSGPSKSAPKCSMVFKGQLIFLLLQQLNSELPSIHFFITAPPALSVADGAGAYSSCPMKAVPVAC